jgi:hypothetical protein
VVVWGKVKLLVVVVVRGKIWALHCFGGGGDLKRG